MGFVNLSNSRALSVDPPGAAAPGLETMITGFSHGFKNISTFLGLSSNCGGPLRLGVPSAVSFLFVCYAGLSDL